MKGKRASSCLQQGKCLLRILCSIVFPWCHDCCTPEAGDRDAADTAARQMEKWEEARGYKVTIFSIYQSAQSINALFRRHLVAAAWRRPHTHSTRSMITQASLNRPAASRQSTWVMSGGASEKWVLVSVPITYNPFMDFGRLWLYVAINTKFLSMILHQFSKVLKIQRYLVGIPHPL